MRWITNNYDITNITLKELPEIESQMDSIRKMKLELMWIELEKEYVFENISEEINLKFPKKLESEKFNKLLCYNDSYVYCAFSFICFFFNNY